MRVTNSHLPIPLAVITALAMLPAAADPPDALAIFPLGGQAGTTVDVRIGGMHLFDECPLALDAADGVVAPATIRRTERVWFEGPVIPKPESQQAENYPSDYAARFTIAADARPGTRWWRVSTSQGVTPSRRFVVGELPEVVEQEIDGTAIPVPVTLPVTINGRIFPREDVDEWSFHAAAGEAGLPARLAARDPRRRRAAAGGGQRPLRGRFARRLYGASRGRLPRADL
jgi:hypothetical protein